MALKSRLELEIDSRTAEQQALAVRKALELLADAGIRATSTLTDVGAAGKKAGSGLGSASGSLSDVAARSAVTETNLAAARKALDALNQSGSRSTSTLNGAGGAMGNVGNGARTATTQVQGLERQVKSLAAQVSGLAGPLAAVFSVKAFYDAAEAYSTLTNRMKLVTSGAQELAAAQTAVFGIAQNARQPLTATAELYQRIATNQKELGLSGKEVAGIVGTISKTMAISGASAASANAALVQLGQAFASGTLRGEELNSVMEQAPALAQAIAAGMGKTVGELRALGAAGLLTADAVVKALQSQQSAVEELFNKMQTTIGQGLTSLGNSFTQLVGKFDQASGASAKISGELLAASKYMDSLTASGNTMASTLENVGNALTVVAAGGATYYAAKIALGTKATLDSVYAYYASRSAAIAAAEATLNQANADVIRTRTAAAAAQADMVLYRGTILQTVAAGRYAEARLAQTAADNAARAATNALASAQGTLLGIQGGLVGRLGGLLGVLGGPAGLAFTVAGVAATYLLFRDNTDEATRSLDQHGLTVDQVTEKYTALSGAQQRVKRLDWVDQQKEALSAASNALDRYLQLTERGVISGTSAGLGNLSAEFKNMIDQVRSGERDLDSVTKWLESSISLNPNVVKAIANITTQYDDNSNRAKELGVILGQLDQGQKNVASSAASMATSQTESGKQTKAQTAEIDKYLGKMREQIALFGASKQAVAGYEAAKLGMNEQQREEARILGAQIDVLEQYKAAIKKGDVARQESLKNELVALYTQQQATEDAAAASAAAAKKVHDEASNAAKESADKQIAQMQRVITTAVNLTKGRNILLTPDQPQTSTGRSMVPIGAPTPQNGTAPRKTPLQMAADAVAQINETIDETTQKVKAYTESAGQKMLDQASQQAAVLREQAGLIGLQKGEIDKIGPAQRELIKWEQQLADIKDKKTLTADQKSLLASQEKITAALKLNASLEKENQLRELSTAEAAKLLTYQQLLSSELELAQQGLSNQLAGIGMGAEGRKRLQEDLKIRQDYQKKMEDLQSQLNKKEITQDLYDKQTGALKDTLEKRLAIQQDYYQKLDVSRAEWASGANAALQDYIYEAGNIAGQTEDLFSNALHGVEDSFVNAATTGKLSFKDLADSIIADLARIVAKAYIVTPILAALGIGGSSAVGAGGAGSLADIFSGGGGGIASTLSSVKNVVSVTSSEFGKSILSGWNGGEGISGGIEGAFTNGADYIHSAITSAFSTGSTTAAQITTESVSQSLTSTLAPSFDSYAAQFGTGIPTASVDAVAPSLLTEGLKNLGQIASVAGTVYNVYQGFKQNGVAGGLTTTAFAAAGAFLGGPAGAAIGSAIGNFVGGKLFGSGEKYPDLSTSAQGTYANGTYNAGGIVQGWQTKAPKYGDAVDAQMNATVAKFTKTLGDLYTAFGSSAQVYAYDLMQVRKTSGKYSTTFGATIDGGGANDLNIHQQFKADDIAAALAANYDDIMGTFLAKAIVSSKSLPDYFKAQFTDFSNSWDTTADEVIKAIEGVFTRFNGVNDALSLIHVNSVKLDDTGLMASDSILNMVGSMAKLDTATASAQDKVDALNKVVGGFYSAFHTADEQFADLTASLQRAFAGFGLELPDTRSAYRQMVEDIDVTTAAGQAMFATMMGLAANADSYYSTLDQKAKDAMDAAAAAMQVVTDGLLKGASDAFSALQRSITEAKKQLTDAYNEQTTALNTSLSSASSRVSDLTGVSNDLGSALKALRGDSDDAVKMLRAQAQATLQSALAIGRAGGSLAGFTGLSDALDTVDNNSTDLYASLEDFNRDQGRTANVVAELNLLNGKQLTSAEKSVKALQDQLKVAEDEYKLQSANFDDQLAFAQLQLDALNGVDNSILGVTDAVNAMNKAVIAALGTVKSATPTNSGTLIDTVYNDTLGRNADSKGKDYWQGQLNSGALNYGNLAGAITNAAAENTIKDAYQNILGHAADAAGAQYWAGQVSSGALTVGQLEQAIKNAAIANGTKIPGYATGGNFGGGIRLVGERGPEIELTGPSRIISNADAAKALSGAQGGGDSSQMIERQAWTNRLLAQVLNAINRQTNQGIPMLAVN